MWITCWFDTVWTPQQLAAAQLTVFEATTGMVTDVSPDTVPVGMVRFFFSFFFRGWVSLREDKTYSDTFSTPSGRCSGDCGRPEQRRVGGALV